MLLIICFLTSAIWSLTIASLHYFIPYGISAGARLNPYNFSLNRNFTTYLAIIISLIFTIIECMHLLQYPGFKWTWSRKFTSSSTICNCCNGNCSYRANHCGNRSLFLPPCFRILIYQWNTSYKLCCRNDSTALHFDFNGQLTSSTFRSIAFPW